MRPFRVKTRDTNGAKLTARLWHVLKTTIIASGTRQRPQSGTSARSLETVIAVEVAQQEVSLHVLMVDCLQDEEFQLFGSATRFFVKASVMACTT